MAARAGRVGQPPGHAGDDRRGSLCNERCRSGRGYRPGDRGDVLGPAAGSTGRSRRGAARVRAGSHTGKWDPSVGSFSSARERSTPSMRATEAQSRPSDVGAALIFCHRAPGPSAGPPEPSSWPMSSSSWELSTGLETRGPDGPARCPRISVASMRGPASTSGRWEPCRRESSSVRTPGVRDPPGLGRSQVVVLPECR